ncbi:MAG: TIGR03000 domain-containing protein [Planctomycetes bacterium]|nr:TIGR03000 domain-containing protein [Planctomycetota bacterium]
MHSVFLTALLSGTALAPAHEPFGGYAGYDGRHPQVAPLRPYCPPGGPCPGAMPAACPAGMPQGVPHVPCFPVFGGVLVGEDSDRLDDIDRTLDQLRKLIKDLSHRLGRLDDRQDRNDSQVKTRLDASEKAITQLTIGQEELHDMIETFEAKLSERVKLLSKTLDFRIMEERLRNGMEALKDREKTLEVSLRLKEIESDIRQGRDAFQRELKQIEDKFAAVQARKSEDAEARAQLRGCEEKIASFQAIKARLDAVETRITESQAERASGQIDRVEKDFGRLHEDFRAIDRRIQEIEGRIKSNPVPGPNQGYQLPANRALVVVNLPQGARLYLEGKLTKGDATLRAFVTPDLESSATYSYTLKAEIQRDGRIEAHTRTVYFRAGNEIRVDFVAIPESMPAAVRNGN